MEISSFFATQPINRKMTWRSPVIQRFTKAVGWWISRLVAGASPYEFWRSPLRMYVRIVVHSPANDSSDIIRHFLASFAIESYWSMNTIAPLDFHIVTVRLDATITYDRMHIDSEAGVPS